MRSLDEIILEIGEATFLQATTLPITINLVDVSLPLTFQFHHHDQEFTLKTDYPSFHQHSAYQKPVSQFMMTMTVTHEKEHDDE